MKARIFSLLTIVLVFVGCSKEEEQTNYAEALYGKWFQTTYLSSSTGTFIGQEDGTYIEFNNDGMFEFFYSGWGSFNETTEGTFTMSTSFLINLTLEDNTKAIITIVEQSENKLQLLFDGMRIGEYEFEKR